MKSRTGEKIGWIGGWVGSYLWIIALAVLGLYQDRIVYGIIMLILFAVGTALIFLKAPWKNPDTIYGKLMLPVILPLFISVTSIIVFHYAELNLGWLTPLMFLPFVFLVNPFLTMGKRKWKDGEDLASKDTIQHKE